MTAGAAWLKGQGWRWCHKPPPPPSAGMSASAGYSLDKISLMLQQGHQNTTTVTTLALMKFTPNPFVGNNNIFSLNVTLNTIFFLFYIQELFEPDFRLRGPIK